MGSWSIICEFSRLPSGSTSISELSPARYTQRDTESVHNIRSIHCGTTGKPRYDGRQPARSPLRYSNNNFDRLITKSNLRRHLLSILNCIQLSTNLSTILLTACSIQLKESWTSKLAARCPCLPTATRIKFNVLASITSFALQVVHPAFQSEAVLTAILCPTIRRNLVNRLDKLAVQVYNPIDLVS